MGTVNMETLPVDRHVWYDGDIVIRDEYRGGAEDAVECGFSDLSEESKETVKNLIIEMTGEFSNTSHIAPLCDLTLDDGTEVPNATVDFSCSVQVADRFRNSSVWQNERSEYLTNLPDAVIEAVVSDILDAKDGKVKIDQLSFGDYLNRAELKDFFSKESGAFGMEENNPEKPEKKKQKYRGR